MRRGYVQLVGTGPGDEDSMSVGALRALEHAEEIWTSDLGTRHRERVYLRKYLRGKKVVNLSSYYALPGVERSQIYRMIADRLVHLAERGRRITFLFSGNPFVWVNITDILKSRAAGSALDLRIVPSMSFLDIIWRDLPFSCRGALQLRASVVSDPEISPDIDCVIGQVGDPGTTAPRHDQVRDFLRTVTRIYGPDHRVYVTGTDPVHAETKTVATRVADLRAVLAVFSGPYHYVVVIPRRGRDEIQ